MNTSDIRFYKPQSTLGGRMSATEAPSGVKNAVWPDASADERAAGSVAYRKSFLKVASTSGTPLQNTRLFIETPTPGDDRVCLFPGTQTDVVADLTGAERLYSGGWLHADAASGAASITVLAEHGADHIFRDGDLIRISNQATVGADGSQEYLRLAATDAVSWNGDVATLTFDAGITLANAYAASDTRVAPVIEVGTIATSVDTCGKVSAAGDYANGDPTTLIAVDAIGGIEQRWTITFSSPSAFTCVGDNVGAVGGGSVGGTFAPNNPAFSRPYFTLPSAGWSGTWVSGDVLTFSTHPAAVAIWQQRVIPAGCGTRAANTIHIGVAGQAT
ncbi:MAG: hypothetical protein ABT940_11680 [Alphaproteobacteria bacterium]